MSKCAASPMLEAVMLPCTSRTVVSSGEGSAGAASVGADAACAPCTSAAVKASARRCERTDSRNFNLMPLAEPPEAAPHPVLDRMVSAVPLQTNGAKLHDSNYSQ